MSDKTDDVREGVLITNPASGELSSREGREPLQRTAHPDIWPMILRRRNKQALLQTQYFDQMRSLTQAKIELEKTEVLYDHLDTILDGVSQKVHAEHARAQATIAANAFDNEMRVMDAEIRMRKKQKELDDVRADSAEPGGDVRKDKWEREKQQKLEEAEAQADLNRELRKARRARTKEIREEMYEAIDDYRDDVLRRYGRTLDYAERITWDMEDEDAVTKIENEFADMIEELDRDY